MPVGLAQDVNKPPNFAISIVASINGYSSTCVFGINQEATTAYSSKFDSLAPDYPATGISSWLFHFNSSYENSEQRLSKYIVPSNGTAAWRFKVKSINQYGTITLTWNDTSFESLTLEEYYGRPLADMNKVSNVSFGAAYNTPQEFNIVYKWNTTTLSAPTPSPSTSTPKPTTTSTSPNFVPMLLIAVSVTVLVVVVAGLLVYFKKRKH